MRIDAVMRMLADRHDTKLGAASGFAGVGRFVARRRTAAMEAAVRRAAEKN